MPTRPGITVRPVRSSFCAFAGACAAILPSTIASVWSSLDAAPVPSMTRTCSSTTAFASTFTNGCSAASTAIRKARNMAAHSSVSPKAARGPPRRCGTAGATTRRARGRFHRLGRRILLPPGVAPVAPRPVRPQRPHLGARIAEAGAEHRLPGDRVSPLPGGENLGRLIGELFEARLQPGLLALAGVGGHVGAEVDQSAGHQQGARPQGEVGVHHPALVVALLPPGIGKL